MRSRKLLVFLILFLLAGAAFCQELTPAQLSQLQYMKHTPFWSRDNKLYFHSVYSYEEIATLPIKGVVGIISYLIPRGEYRGPGRGWLDAEKAVVFFEWDPASGEKKNVPIESIPYDYSKISAKGLWVVSHPKDREKLIIADTGGKIFKIIDTRPYVLSFGDWSPDGAEMICPGYEETGAKRENGLFIVNINNSKVIKIPGIEKAARRGIKNMVWRQGSRIAFNVFDRGKTYVVDRNNLAQLRELDNVRSDEIALSSKSPDKLFFTAYDPRRRGLKSIDLARADAFPETLYEPPSREIGGLKTSPGGEYLLFQSAGDIYVMKVSDRSLRKVAQGGLNKFKFLGGKLQ
jgi:hypothetical protein